MVDEDLIKREVFARVERVQAQVDWLTPSGRRRSSPIYSADIRNAYLRKERTIKASDESTLRRRAQSQLQSWAEEEVRTRVREATRDSKETARANADDADADARARVEAIRKILSATLDVDDRIDWDQLLDKGKFPSFKFQLTKPIAPPLPPEPVLPSKPFWSWLLPSLTTRWRATCELRAVEHAAAVQYAASAHAERLTEWEQRLQAAQLKHAVEGAAFEEKKQQHNEAVRQFRQRFEAAEPDALEEYVRAVFERSSYPEGFSVEHSVAFDTAAKTAVVDVELPAQDTVPDVAGFKFTKATSEATPVRMKAKDHEAFYEEALRQTVVRTIHEVFEAVYTPSVQRVVVNGWVTRVDPATGHEVRRCVISVSSQRADFGALNLARIDTKESLRKLKAVTAGALSQVAPVQPILVFNRDDERFIEARAVLDGLGSERNLAEIPWEDFEHLVRELFGKMFSGEGAEVKVTQASRDQGVDAVVFDPDPIRGGKFVIQAKRYTKTVSVSAVRELYGTMINEGAVKGILVTTASFGPDSREFAKDKPIALIDGANLVHLLGQHGHKVRIDIAAARVNRATG